MVYRLRDDRRRRRCADALRDDELCRRERAAVIIINGRRRRDWPRDLVRGGERRRARVRHERQADWARGEGPCREGGDEILSRRPSRRRRRVRRHNLISCAATLVVRERSWIVVFCTGTAVAGIRNFRNALLATQPIIISPLPVLLNQAHPQPRCHYTHLSLIATSIHPAPAEPAPAPLTSTLPKVIVTVLFKSQRCRRPTIHHHLARRHTACRY